MEAKKRIKSYTFRLVNLFSVLDVPQYRERLLDLDARGEIIKIPSYLDEGYVYYLPEGTFAKEFPEFQVD